MDGNICKRFMKYSIKEQEEIANILQMTVTDVKKTLLSVSGIYYCLLECNSFFVFMSDRDSQPQAYQSVSVGSFEFTSLPISSLELKGETSFVKNHVYGFFIRLYTVYCSLLKSRRKKAPFHSSFGEKIWFLKVHLLCRVLHRSCSDQ